MPPAPEASPRLRRRTQITMISSPITITAPAIRNGVFEVLGGPTQKRVPSRLTGLPSTESGIV